MKSKSMIAEDIFLDLCQMCENTPNGAILAPNYMRPIFEAMERFVYLMHSDDGYLSAPINRVVSFVDVYSVSIDHEQS